MLQRIVLVLATAFLGLLFGSGPLRVATPRGVPLSDFWAVSAYASHVLVFGVYGLLPALTALALILAAMRQRRLGDGDAASTSEGWAKVFVALLVLVQVLMIPYHELRLTGVHQLGTVVKLGTRKEGGYKGPDVTCPFVDVDTALPGGKTVRTSPRISPEDAQRVKEGDRVDTFSNSDESSLGAGATLSDGRAVFGGIFVGTAFWVFLQDLFKGLWKKWRAKGPAT